MEIKKLSEFENATTINDSDILLIEQSGLGKSVSITDLRKYIFTPKVGDVLSDGSILFYDRGSNYGNYLNAGEDIVRISDGDDDGTYNSQNWRYLICDARDLGGAKSWGG